MRAYIHGTPNKLLPAQTNKLQINDKNIGFLDNSIIDNCHFYRRTNSDWQLTFFANTSFETTLSVEFKDKEEKLKSHIQAKAIWINKHLSKENDDAEINKSLKIISNFSRDSDTLTKEQLIETSAKRFFIADRDAIGYMSFAEDQFQRAIICQCLAVAYRIIILAFRKQVTEAMNKKTINNEALLNLYRQVLIFNAAHFFRYPVDLTNHELRVIWDEIHQNWCLQELNAELTEQLDAVAKLLQSENDRKLERIKQEELQQQKLNDAKLEELKQRELNQQNQRKEERELQIQQQTERDSKFNKKMTLFGVLLALLSALSLIELTPQHFIDAYNNWLSPVAQYIINLIPSGPKQ